jgi:hypothetical protein
VGGRAVIRPLPHYRARCRVHRARLAARKSRSYSGRVASHRRGAIGVLLENGHPINVNINVDLINAGVDTFPHPRQCDGGQGCTNPW